ncbi:PH domain-containing protein [Synechococcus elongatus]|uniref:PH domain-containing protein n=2 Tax=Synechococcus elongatus TaxID=32046 RepID=A0AAN1QPT3_SYNEL|nr:PH domain-containing protein [Synechococcus elongatus]AZB73146.1 PH domain-containing protein [Synechococcus elongatus PCC 11801]QFZ92308.1 PH domain-containing protein [Synechococcus elongatus PCC 11802]
MAVNEEVFYEGGPHKGDLILNLLIGLTLVGLPLAVGAIVRALWLRFRITNRRITVTGGWQGRERSEIIYSEIADLVSIPRGLGFWGDICLILKDRSRLEMRSVPNYRGVVEFIKTQMAAKQAKTVTAA